MTRARLSSLIALAVVACGGGRQAPAPAPAAQTQGERSLYQRLGGYDALAAVTDDFLGRIIADANLKPFFEKLSEPEVKRVRQMVVDQLCAATGGPCLYVGKEMRDVHQGLGITERDWQISVQHLVATLQKFNVPPRERTEVLAFVSSLKGDIVIE